jgi:glucose/arabinose dehydrogenase
VAASDESGYIEKSIFELPPLSATNHNGGAIHFGRDGKLYVAVGENAVPGNAQSLNTVLGKMLRIHKDGSIPEDNPFYTQTTDNNRAIWAFGLRNPYSFDVQPGTGRIFINDVGQNTWEEIDDGIVGTNYGWPIYEGPVKYMANRSKKRRYRSVFTRLIFAYKHGSDETRGCAITGGAFYNPGTGASTSFPTEYEGDYFFADFCSGWIRRLDPTTNAVEGFKASSDENPVDLKVSQDGDLYFLARGTGSVEKIHFNG